MINISAVRGASSHRRDFGCPVMDRGSAILHEPFQCLRHLRRQSPASWMGIKLSAPVRTLSSSDAGRGPATLDAAR
jgi:hypothetical protein